MTLKAQSEIRNQWLNGSNGSMKWKLEMNTAVRLQGNGL